MFGEFKAATLFLGATLLIICATACSGAVPAAPTSAPVKPTVPAAVATRTAAPVLPTAAAPTSAPVKPTSAPAPTQAANPASSASSGYDGDWSGTTSSDDMPISFTVENNQLTYVNLGYAVQSGSCTVSGSQSQNANVHIDGKSFIVQFTDDNGYQYNFTGTFTSNAQANGTLNVKGTSTVCGAFEAKATWNAKFGAADTSSNSSTASDASDATPTAAIADTDVLLAFFEAVNAKKLDDALALVDDQVVFNIAGTPGIGKDALKAYLQNQTNRNVTFTLSNLISNDGITVHFTLKTSDKPAPVDDDNASVGDNVLQTLVLR